MCVGTQETEVVYSFGPILFNFCIAIWAISITSSFMLTASLQSTWETQRNRQGRPKYLQSHAYGEDSDNEKNGNQIRAYGNSRDLSGGGSTDLPNLRIPSVRIIILAVMH